jgi:RNA polymerase sigma-70 factor (ECF subfamily)
MGGGTTGPANDEALLAAIAAGDAQALASLYDRLAQPVLNLAFRVLGAALEAEDVLQDAFLEVWRAAASYDGRRGGVATWVLGIARNRAIDRLRAARARLARDRAAGAASSEREPAAPADEQAASGEVGRLIRSAFGRLPDDQRRALELSYLDGLSHTEVAERLGVPLGTVKTRIRLALAKLRDALPSGVGGKQ